MSEPKLGDFFVSSTGFGGNLNAKFLSKLVQWGTSSPVNHAGVYVGEGKVITISPSLTFTSSSKQKVVEAQPGGARYADVEHYLGENSFWTTKLIGRKDDPSKDDSFYRELIVENAIKTIGTPYGYLDIIAIGIAQKRLGSKIDVLKAYEDQPWWVKRLTRKDRLICSQLCDYVYLLSGLHLYDDGRMSQLVSPGDLYRLILENQ